jgi:hypothetical protein
MNSFEAFLSDIRKARNPKAPYLANKEDEVLGARNYDPKLRICFGIMASSIVGMNCEMCPSVILISSKNFLYGRRDERYHP